jgi:predicted membrane-bound spermidine synthase
MVRESLGRWRDAVFFASGFAGLIYESIWTQYLKLFLGHAAYAQTIVLATFMGGMAIGAALTARHTLSIARPLRAYACVEAAIGVLALAFHPVFVGTTGGFLDFAFGAHLDPTVFELAKWSLAGVLILPQSILLGATFPLFASAATRGVTTGEGRPIAMLYFANSFGGAVGVLASGFLLIPAAGLFGAIAIAGALNLVIAATVLALTRKATARAAADAQAPAPVASAPAPRASTKAKRRAQQAARRSAANEAGGKGARAASTASAQPTAPPRPAPIAAMGGEVTARFLLTVAFFTGASSFVYEIGWIRMLSLVLGSATHSFELMLSAFVLGLALGGLWIRTRIDTSPNPGALLGVIQIVMGAAALATVPLHSLSFDVVAWAVQTLPKTDAGYALFNIMRYGIASVIMLPAAFCAGMTLPLATRLLFATGGAGERAIGLVYSVNTVGAIAGLAFAVHVGLPALGLEYLVGSGALVDVLLGAALLAAYGQRRRIGYAAAAVVAGVAATFAVARSFDPQQLASGVFRTGRASTVGKVLEVRHGKTATITVERNGDIVIIKTNGKADASAYIKATGAYVQDQVTMLLLGAMPLLMLPDPKHVANIGFGSGLTGEMVLSDSRVQTLDTIEIEPRMVELARAFDPLNRSVYNDPRSAIRYDDAKSFFAANGRKYDLILSEPSNPWVSGVSGLFSVEFYRHVSRYLNEGGLFAQWLQTYETSPERIASVLKAMDQAFEDYLVIAVDAGDILLIGTPRGKVVMPPDALAKAPAGLRQELRKIDIANQSDVMLRIAGNKALLRPWLATQAAPVNSDFAPYLDSNADRDRYFALDWDDFTDLAKSAFPIVEVMGARAPFATPSSLTISPQLGPDIDWLAARLIWEQLFGPPKGPDAIPIPSRLPPELMDEGRHILAGCDRPPPGDVPYATARFGTRVLPFLSPTEGSELLGALRGRACFVDLYGTQQAWSVLLRHVAERDWRNFGRLADEMLESGQGSTPVRARYLLGLAMLGRIRAGESARAQVVWDKHAPRALNGEPPRLALELLRAYAFAGVGASANPKATR